MNKYTISFDYGLNKITLEYGIIAKKADSSVIIKMDDTLILITIVKGNKLINSDFLPLTVNYYERLYSIGKFPSGFLKREVRQTEHEIIISRIIDRSIRPLFPKNYSNEIQITAIAMSIDNNVASDIASIIGVSSALMISEIPFFGPIYSCKVGLINNKFILNPSYDSIKNSDLDLILTSTNNSILMIESSSNFLSNDTILDAINFGISYRNDFMKNINNFYKFKNNNNINNFEKYNNNLYTINLIKILCYNDILKTYNILNKIIRNEKLNILKINLINNLKKILKNFNEYYIENKFKDLEKIIIRNKILKFKTRLDNRLLSDIRNINSSISILPRAHGSSIFIRGETQAIVSVTLGSDKNSQNIENLHSNEYNTVDTFIFHYNFPPYCVGEIGKLGFPKRREIGHGKLAKKSIIPIIPNKKDFPYTIRIVSEITESNGSSSMASVCGASLALMDAGVPIKSIVVGVAMGLIKENENFIILTDISGEEDFFGDIDFKIAGNRLKITTLQMDVKNNLIDINIIKKILVHSEIARCKILNSIKNTISSHKTNLSKFAPKIHILNINKEKIGCLIGKGGQNIKKITDETQSEIDINDDGTIKIFSNNKNKIKYIIEKINKITKEISIGDIYNGIIIKILSNGILLSIDNNKCGFINISYLNKFFNNKTKLSNFYIGQKFIVKIKNIDQNGKISLVFNKN